MSSKTPIPVRSEKSGRRLHCRARTAVLCCATALIVAGCGLGYPPPEAGSIPASGPSPSAAPSGPGGSIPTPTIAPSPAPTIVTPASSPPAPPIIDAAAFRDALLQIAEANLDSVSGPGQDFGVIAAWEFAYPKVEFTNYALKATTKSVSVFANLVDPGATPGADNPYLIAFSVRDERGRCRGGILAGFPAPGDAGPIEPGGPSGCTAIDAAAAGGFDLG